MRLALNLYQDYKEYLKAALQARGRGSQTRLADELRCTRSFLSQVLQGKLHLTQEQGLRAAHYLELDAQNTRYFLLLIQRERAETPELRDFLARDIERFRKNKFASFAFSAEREERIRKSHRSEFFSSWRYMAIAGALKIRRLRAAKDLAAYLGISEKETHRVLERLKEMGLVVQEEGEWKLLSGKAIILDEDPMLLEHVHRSGLAYQADAIARGHKWGSSYSAFCPLARKDALAISDVLVKAMQQIHEIALNTKNPDQLYFICTGFSRSTLQD